MSCFMVINGICSTNIVCIHLLCHTFKLNIVIEIHSNFCPHILSVLVTVEGLLYTI